MTLLAPVAVLPNFVIRPDWSRAIRFSPAIIAAGVAAWQGWNFEAAFAFIALIAVIVGPRPRAGRWTYTTAISLALLVFLDFGEPRPRGWIFKNALTAGQALALAAIPLNLPLLAAAAGFTGSRSPLLILAAPFRRSWGYVFLLIGYGIGFLAFMTLISPETLTDPGAGPASRIDVGAGIASRGDLDSAWWQGWTGTGYGDFPVRQRPHNAFLSLWAQVGILSVPILATFAWHGRRIHWRTWLPLLPALWFSDWLFSTPGGIATLGVYFALAHEQSKRPEQHDQAAQDIPVHWVRRLGASLGRFKHDRVDQRLFTR